ncbi:MAG: SapC family protein [Paracoccaceae bacterium]|nr:SapC family protein [Paracoccaceae bacterium]
MPILSQSHGKLGYRRNQTYAFARDLPAVPLIADEMPRAQGDFPIVFTPAPPHMPVALLGGSVGNAFIDESGAWTRGRYLPAYLRRYPFALVRDKADSERMVLCADLSAEGFFETDGAQVGCLFDEVVPSERLNKILKFCETYESGLVKTRRLCEELNALDLFENSRVTLHHRGGKKIKLEGFMMIQEEKLREQSDAVLAGLVRRGVAGLIAAHHFSLAQFSALDAVQK